MSPTEGRRSPRGSGNIGEFWDGQDQGKSPLTGSHCEKEEDSEKPCIHNTSKQYQYRTFTRREAIRRVHKVRAPSCRKRNAPVAGSVWATIKSPDRSMSTIFVLSRYLRAPEIAISSVNIELQWIHAELPGLRAQSVEVWQGGVVT